ncbi:MAG TPA: DUF6346 domain-containing protein [Stackebrandtia sp.]|jgi:hypothetical protein|uniref:DUF6346 domain-containing protein n=1 Tax=Stackebrandtia sp. TaxID=2023065 RepID=UPI002D5C4E77|nr:DUF6346 domain-containing protein [Stackebrandtia sp.]HZE37820.1 DUF6346 domain-containing protein [Stackebrandtia sp.]
MSSGSRRGPSTFLLILIGVVALAAGWTALNFRGGVADVKDLSDRPHATALVKTCKKAGPISISGVGYWWTCKVAITTKTGHHSTQTFNGSQFTPDDKGKKFPLAGAGRTSSTWSRADVDSNNIAVMSAAAGMIIGIIALIVAGRRLLRR